MGKPGESFPDKSSPDIVRTLRAVCSRPAQKHVFAALAVVVLLSGTTIPSVYAQSLVGKLLDPVERILDKPNRCNCVIVRLDDVQDFWIRNVQVGLMDALISNKVHTSAAIILNAFGNDPVIVSKVKQGGDAGVFEYSVHGWNHVDHTQLSRDQQLSTMMQSKQKLVNVLGKDSNVFVPPLNKFNDNTLEVMEELGMTVMSADRFTDPYPWAPKVPPLYPTVMHMPESIDFAYSSDNTRVTRPVLEVILDVRKNVEERGYGVLTLHPQDFAQYKDGVRQNAVNQTAITQFVLFVTTARLQGYSFVGFEESIKLNHPDPSTIPDSSNPYVKITSPASGSTLQKGSEIVVTGRAFDDTKLKAVEVRTDVGSYRPVSSSNDYLDWTIQITLPNSQGKHDIIARATDTQGKVTWFTVSVNLV